MDTESLYWIAIVIFAAVTFSIIAFTAGMLRGRGQSQQHKGLSELELRAEIVSLQCQIEDIRFELRRSKFRNK